MITWTNKKYIFVTCIQRKQVYFRKVYENQYKRMDIELKVIEMERKV